MFILLPFYPWTDDDGFSVVDFYTASIPRWVAGPMWTASRTGGAAVLRRRGEPRFQVEPAMFEGHLERPTRSMRSFCIEEEPVHSMPRG